MLAELERFYEAFTAFMRGKERRKNIGGILLEKRFFTSKYPYFLYGEDKNYRENILFDYPVIAPENKKDGSIIIGHGLNEGDYTKLLPWAYILSKKLKRTVVIFPLSFHMNRRPRSWLKKVIAIYRKRKSLKGNRSLSPMNAILSSRLHEAPERFIMGARQSFYDFLELLNELAENYGLPIDFLGYSLGGFLMLSILLNNNLPSKAVVFCSGSSFYRSDPESPLILDSLSIESLRKYYQKNDLKAVEEPDKWFFSLFLGRNNEELKKRVSDARGRLLIIAGKKDKVTPPDAIEENLGTKLDLLLDLGIHEVPFTASEEDLENIGELHKKLKKSYTVDERFKGAFEKFINASVEFLGNE